MCMNFYDCMLVSLMFLRAHLRKWRTSVIWNLICFAVCCGYCLQRISVESNSLNCRCHAYCMLNSFVGNHRVISVVTRNGLDARGIVFRFPASDKRLNASARPVEQAPLLRSSVQGLRMSRALPPLTSTPSLHGIQRMKHLICLTIQYPTWKIAYCSL